MNVPKKKIPSHTMCVRGLLLGAAADEVKDSDGFKRHFFFIYVGIDNFRNQYGKRTVGLNVAKNPIPVYEISLSVDGKTMVSVRIHSGACGEMDKAYVL